MIRLDSRKGVFLRYLFLCNYQSTFLLENIKWPAFNRGGNMRSKNKYFVLCIAILLVHECETTANGFYHFSTIPTVSLP